MKKKYQIITVVIISVFLVAFFLSIYITVEEKMPGNAVVVITIEDRLYHSIHFDYICLAKKTAKTTTSAKAVAKGYPARKRCYI